MSIHDFAQRFCKKNRYRMVSVDEVFDKRREEKNYVHKYDEQANHMKSIFPYIHTIHMCRRRSVDIYTCLLNFAIMHKIECNVLVTLKKKQAQQHSHNSLQNQG